MIYKIDLFCGIYDMTKRLKNLILITSTVGGFLELSKELVNKCSNELLLIEF